MYPAGGQNSLSGPAGAEILADSTCTRHKPGIRSWQGMPHQGACCSRRAVAVEAVHVTLPSPCSKPLNKDSSVLAAALIFCVLEQAPPPQAMPQPGQQGPFPPYANAGGVQPGYPVPSYPGGQQMQR